jgi:hypothetical protein
MTCVWDSIEKICDVRLFSRMGPKLELSLIYLYVARPFAIFGRRRRRRRRRRLVGRFKLGPPVLAQGPTSL